MTGAKMYSLLRNLLALNFPQEKKSYRELVSKLKSHFSPKPLVISERFKFYGRKQGANGSITDFVLIFADSQSTVNSEHF